MSDEPFNIASKRPAKGSRTTSRSFERHAPILSHVDRMRILDAECKHERAKMLDRSMKAYIDTFYHINKVRFGNQLLIFKLKK